MNLRATNSTLGHRSYAEFLGQPGGPSVFRVRSTVWLVGLVAAFLQAWAFRWVVNPDGISYLDIARACAGGNWHSLANGYWSPLYPLILSVVLRVVKPSPYWESTVAHLTGLGIFAFAFLSFDIFLKALIRDKHPRPAADLAREPLHESSIWLIGDLLFVCYTLLFLNLQVLSPDLCLAGLVYLATAFLLRIRAGDHRWFTWVGFGAVLGAGYLAKAIMFPLAFVFLACAFFVVKPRRKSVPYTALALVVFLLIGSPLFIALSKSAGRLTFGETGKIAYAEFVNGATRAVHWLGGPPGTGIPVHPARMIRSSPPLFVFATPVKGSYPLWYDPSYWYAGIKPRFSLKDQLRAIRYTIQEYAAILPYMGGVFVGFLGLALFAGSGSELWRQLLDQWPVWIPAAAALGLYGLIYVESRYVAPFFVLIWISLFAGLRFPDTLTARVLEKCIALTIAIMLGVGVVWLAGRSLFRALAPGTFVQWNVSEGLRDMGVRPGDCVGSIGDSLGAYWAHLANVRIIADIPPDGVGSYLSSPPQIQSEVLADFAREGATVIVTDQALGGSDKGWRAIGQTRFFVHNVSSESSSPETQP